MVDDISRNLGVLWVLMFNMFILYHKVGKNETLPLHRPINPVKPTYKMVIHLQNTHKRHSIACPWGRGMECLLWLHIWSISQAGKLKFFGTRPSCLISYLAYTKFHLPRPVFHLPGKIFTRIGERASASFPAWYPALVLTKNICNIMLW